MNRRGLIVCSANVCRSPVAERLLRTTIDARPDVEGRSWSISSAGILPLGAPMDPNTLGAAAAVGIDLSDHQARELDDAILATDGADLVVVMSRAELRHVVGMDPTCWPRTFTLKELARRAAAAPPPQPVEGLGGWLSRISEGRRAAELMTPDPLDDVADPYGQPRPAHVAMVAELSAAIDNLADCGLWRPPEPPA